MEPFPAISISDFQLPIFRSRRAIYTCSIQFGLFRMRPMFLLRCMDSANGRSRRWIFPCRSFAVSPPFIWSTCAIWARCLRCRSRSSAKESSGDSSAGIISGPRTVPYLVRSACDLLTRLVATQLMGLATSASLHQMVHFHAVQRRMLTQMAGENNYLAAMADQMEDLIQITGAEGVALLMDGQI